MAVLMGSEALLMLRAEKGYIIVGKDTDGTSCRTTSASPGRATSGSRNSSASARCSPKTPARPTASSLSG